MQFEGVIIVKLINLLKSDIIEIINKSKNSKRFLALLPTELESNLHICLCNGEKTQTYTREKSAAYQTVLMSLSRMKQFVD